MPVPRFHWSVYAGGVAGALATLFIGGPVAVAVVMLRCCDGSSGPTAEAWLAVACLLATIVALGAAAAGFLCWPVHRAVKRGA